MRFPFNWTMFPSTDYNKINLDWIFDTLKKLVAGQEAMDQAVEEAQQAAADAEAAAAGIVGAVKYDAPQALDAAEQAQARSNIGAASATDLSTTDATATAAAADAANAVSYAAPQALDATEQAQARSNIGAASATDLSTTDATATAAAADAANAVSYAVAQALDATEQAQARSNIGAASATDLSTTDATATAAATAAADTVKYVAQTLTVAEKAQARDNIGAADASGVFDFSTKFALTNKGSATFSGVSGLSVTRNGLQYAINADGTVGRFWGNICIQITDSSMSGSVIDIPITGLQVAAPGAGNSYKVPLNGVVARASSGADNVDTQTYLTRLYNYASKFPQLYIDASGNVYFEWEYTYSGGAGNYMMFWIPPCLLLFDKDSN